MDDFLNFVWMQFLYFIRYRDIFHHRHHLLLVHMHVRIQATLVLSLVAIDHTFFGIRGCRKAIMNGDGFCHRQQCTQTRSNRLQNVRGQAEVKKV